MNLLSKERSTTQETKHGQSLLHHNLVVACGKSCVAGGLFGRDYDARAVESQNCTAYVSVGSLIDKLRLV